MNARINSSGVGSPQPIDPGELAEIHSASGLTPLLKARPLLSQEEEAVSLPALELPVDPLQQMLKEFLGPALTSDNPVWRGDPVPSMRGLQRMMVEHALSLAEGEPRRPMMAALRQVEKAVQMRLRWLQMKRSEAESTIVEGEGQDAPEKTR
ncbi:MULTISPECIES: hypothetical protein [unclassified Herbaspirillum]|uniref:hypothetical protein n=1 Tax=unclassified Herbaspirillum TaxID=2624150 RepID=UPI00116A4F59|nr:MULTISPECIES: hypothetical protein [unclassified Herbaspirillum]MBB5391361.1 hypothetical protein [Herbaspirillum sp. SJZ102]TQK12952.1 hypothetical protein FB599_0359 [Herbaspirillum sp. SJZ130]TQK14956.1 hypothetical protein FB598_0297 [Herbaspirillum sp. SJZ106]TWC67311.1 hypothetical protein FB597_104121 [Herbaspirillum sp. SJZ099]